MRILVINCGSSSVKYKLYNFKPFKLLTKGLVERIGEEGSPVKDHYQAIFTVFKRIKSLGREFEEISAIGHRVVHGGEKFKQPVLIDKEVIKEIRKNVELAPLHNPANLEGILACKKFFPSLKQVAVFDTAFHQTIPQFAYLYAVPFNFYKKYKIRKYGFHGTSHQYVAEASSKIMKKSLKKLKLITVHLGNGCSISAIKYGKCIDTSMGFTPLEGLIMGTRSGDIDAAIIFYLAKQAGLTLEEIEKILNRQSGLLGISGVSNDLRLIKEACKKGNLRAKLAIEMFIYRLRKYLGAYILILGGVDAIIFTAGIGENNPDIIKRAVWGLEFLRKKPAILVVPTDEELMIAKLVYDKIKRRKGGRKL